MAAEELRHRLHHDIRAELDGPQQHRRGDGVVDDQRHALRMRDRGQCLDIADIAGGVADGLAEDRDRILVDQLCDIVGLVRGGEARRHAHARQDVGEERVCRAIELRHRHDVAAGIGDAEHRVMERRLARSEAERAGAAMQRRQPPLEHGGRRVADAAIAEALGFEIEQGSGMGRAVEFVGDGLVNRNGGRPHRCVGVVTRMNGKGLGSHRPALGNAARYHGSKIISHFR